ncbi:hypothetical protein GE061_020340 [Apolygus lucorum]|uniref:CCHC-type domain-containing protein n=1 Tax=Apolygus lucorum TaxID=248454 RepID=A0A8S9WIM0_APOLU|nr:hypothetical protein GE061_020339 [Apolygus lucorum]KAF6197303.1 hypothetical protein GE061_020340 [Apolygus lucorum]
MDVGAEALSSQPGSASGSQIPLVAEYQAKHGKFEGGGGKKRRRDDSPQQQVENHMKSILSCIDEVVTFLHAPESKINKVKAQTLSALLHEACSSASELNTLASYYAGRYSGVREILEDHLNRISAEPVGDRMQDQGQPSYSPILRAVEEVKRGVYEASPVVSAVNEMGKRYNEQSRQIGQFLEQQKRTYGEVMKGGRAAVNDEWTKVGRKGRALDFQPQTSTAPTATRTPAKPKDISQVRADIRARIRQRGGPTPARDSRAIVITGTADGEDVMKKLSAGVNPKDLGLEIASSRSIRGGGVVIEVKGSVDLKNLMENEKVKDMGLTIKEAPSKRPRILIHGVPSSLEAGELEKEFWEDNCQDIGDADKADGFKPIHKAGPKSQSETKWVVQVSQAVRRVLIQEGRVRLGWLVCRVVDHISVSRCYKCHKFGHVARGCGRDEICGWCAEKGHGYRDCTKRSQPACCTNCQDAGRPKEHDAGSLECPSYRIAMENQVRLTDYGKDD